MALEWGNPSAREVGELLRLMRERAGLSQEELAQRLQVDQTAISKRETGTVNTNLKFLKKVIDVLEPGHEEVLELLGLPRGPQLPKRQASLQKLWPAQHIADFIPVFGISGKRGLAALTSQFAVDWTPRPPTLLNVADGYAIYMPENYMVPRFQAGQRLYVDPHRPPRPSCGIVIVSKKADIMVRHLITGTDDVISGERLQPAPQVDQFAREDLDAVHMIVGLDEI